MNLFDWSHLRLVSSLYVIMAVKLVNYAWASCDSFTQVRTFRNPSNRCSCGKLSQTTLQLTLPVPLLHEPIPPVIVRMAANDMIFSFSSDGASPSLGPFSGSGSLSPWQLSVTSEKSSGWFSLNTSSSIVSTWLLFEAKKRNNNPRSRLNKNVNQLANRRRGIELEIFLSVGSRRIQNTQTTVYYWLLCRVETSLRAWNNYQASASHVVL